MLAFKKPKKCCTAFIEKVVVESIGPFFAFVKRKEVLHGFYRESGNRPISHGSALYSSNKVLRGLDVGVQ